MTALVRISQQIVPVFGETASFLTVKGVGPKQVFSELRKQAQRTPHLDIVDPEDGYLGYLELHEQRYLFAYPDQYWVSGKQLIRVSPVYVDPRTQRIGTLDHRRLLQPLRISPERLKWLQKMFDVLTREPITYPLQKGSSSKA